MRVGRLDRDRVPTPQAEEPGGPRGLAGDTGELRRDPIGRASCRPGLDKAPAEPQAVRVHQQQSALAVVDAGERRVD